MSSSADGDTDIDKWDRRYRDAADDIPTACSLLQHYAHLLPAGGKALDLACGRGGNALLLAIHGLDAHAWDHSQVAISQLNQLAHTRQLVVHTTRRDVIAHPPETDSFDVIVVSRFLHRALCPALAAALRPDGLLFYQTFSRERPASCMGPENPDFLLAEGELLRLFPALQIRLYREEGLPGDTQQGLRGEAWLIAQRD